MNLLAPIYNAVRALIPKIESRAPASTALSNQVWTNALAGALLTRTELIQEFAFGTGFWTVPKTGWYFIQLVGGGGSGGPRYTGNGTYASGNGGAGGGIWCGWIFFQEGEKINYIVGAGGAGLSPHAYNVQGKLGGPTEFAEASASGGAGGMYGTYSNPAIPGVGTGYGLPEIRPSKGYGGFAMSGSQDSAYLTGKGGKGAFAFGDGGEGAQNYPQIGSQAGKNGLIRIFGEK